MGCFYNVYISLYKIYNNSNNINLSLIIKHGWNPWVHCHNTLLSVNLRFSFFLLVLIDSPSNCCEVVLKTLSIQLVHIHILLLGLHACFGLHARFCICTLPDFHTCTQSNPTSIAYMKVYQFIYLGKLHINNEPLESTNTE